MTQLEWLEVKSSTMPSPEEWSAALRPLTRLRRLDVRNTEFRDPLALQARAPARHTRPPPQLGARCCIRVCLCVCLALLTPVFIPESTDIVSTDFGFNCDAF